jgi:hypothetical protein
MPYAPHLRLTASGDLYGGAEKFSFGVNLNINGGPAANLNIDDGQFADIVTDTVNFFQRSGTGVISRAVLREVKVASIGALGTYTADPKISGILAAPGFDVTGNVKPPAQTSLAVSLNTARRGATGRGRFYLPLPGGAVGDDGLYTDVYRDNVAASVKQWLDDLNNEPNVDVLGLRVIVASSKGYNTDVTGVRVGRVPDTMRSRRRSLNETYELPLALAGNDTAS